MTTTTTPFGGSFVSATTARDELGTYSSTAAPASVGTYTGVPMTGRLGRFVDAQFRRGGSVTASNRTVTGSFRTATGSFRTA
ncbi:hypothetical protein ACLBWP_10210 [Microbacterium sp. M1A1_1b]